MRKGEIVLLTWDDIRTDLSTDEYREPLIAYAVGCVAKQDKKTVWLKSGWYKDPEFPAKDTITIPKGCIRKIEKLGVL